MTRAFEKYVTVPDQTGIIMVIEKEFGPISIIPIGTFINKVRKLENLIQTSE